MQTKEKVKNTNLKIVTEYTIDCDMKSIWVSLMIN